jgi:hypothetical protein
LRIDNLRSAARLCALFVVILLSLVARAADLNNSEVQARLARGEIVVDLEREPGTHTLVGTAVGVIDAPREQVWAVLGDYDHFPEFMPRFKACFILRPDVITQIGDKPNLRELEPMLRANKLDSSSADTLLLFHSFNFPFPLGDRCCLVRKVLNGVTFRSHYAMVTGEFKVNEGSWELRPYGKKTLAIYITRTDPGLAVPGFLLSMGTRSILPDVIKGVRKRVREMFPNQNRK